MISPNRLSACFVLTLIVVFVFSSQPLLADNPDSEKALVEGPSETKVHFSGESIGYINAAYKDYIKRGSDNLDIKYFIFVVHEEGNSIIVEIRTNQELLKADTGFIRKGGGGKYWFKEGTKTIQRSVGFK